MVIVTKIKIVIINLRRQTYFDNNGDNIFRHDTYYNNNNL